jgi:hypothetical protein
MRDSRMHEKRMSNARAQALLENLEKRQRVSGSHELLVKLLSGSAPESVQWDMLIGELRHGKPQHCSGAARTKCHAGNRAAGLRTRDVVAPLWAVHHSA